VERLSEEDRERRLTHNQDGVECLRGNKIQKQTIRNAASVGLFSEDRGAKSGDDCNKGNSERGADAAAKQLGSLETIKRRNESRGNAKIE